MSECDYLVTLGNESLKFKLFSVLHRNKLCDRLGDLLAPLALSHKRNDVFRTGNKPANISSNRAQDAIDISSFESCMKLLHQLQMFLLAYRPLLSSLQKIAEPAAQFGQIDLPARNSMF
jgi:hypothetical protein